MENCVICGKTGVMFRESGYVCEYHGSMCDRGYDLADIVEEEKNDAEVAAMQAFEKSIGWGEATAPTAAAQGEVVDDDDDEPLELSVHRFIPGLWRVTHVDGVASMELVAEDATDPKAELQKLIDKGLSIDAIKLYRKMYDSDLNTARGAVLAMRDNKPTYAALEAALQQAQRERDATDAAIAPFIAIAKSVIDNRHKLPWYNGDNPVAFSMGGVGVTFEDCSRLLSTMAREYGRRAASALQAAQPADGEG